jgi:hypothetical protein
MKAPDMMARFTKDLSMKAPHTGVRAMRDHDMEALIMTAPLAVARPGIRTRCPMQVPSRLLVVTALPTFLLLLRRQDLKCRGQQQLNIVCRTLQFPHTTTHLLSNRDRPREHLRKFLRSACQSRPRAHLLMPPLLSLSLQSWHLDAAPKQLLPLHTSLEGLRTPLALRRVYHFLDHSLLDALMKFSRTMGLGIPRLSCQTIASAVSI